MKTDQIITELGISPEEALRILYLARKHSITVDVARDAIHTAQELVRIEIEPRGTSGETDAFDSSGIVPYRRGQEVLLAAYLPETWAQNARNRARRRNKPFDEFLLEALEYYDLALRSEADG